MILTRALANSEGQERILGLVAPARWRAGPNVSVRLRRQRMARQRMRRIKLKRKKAYRKRRAGRLKAEIAAKKKKKPA